MDERFIALEGPDGSGKTEQWQLLAKRMRSLGYRVELVDLPQYDKPSSLWVKSYLKGDYGAIDKVDPRRASIFYALDRFDAGLQVRKWLNEGAWVLTNRWVASNMGHQGTKVPADKLQEFFDWEIDLEYNIFQIPEPLTIILHVPAEVSLELIKQRSAKTGKPMDLHEVLDHLQKSEKIYRLLPELWPEEDKLVECYENGRLLSIDEIHERVWAIIEPRLQ